MIIETYQLWEDRNDVALTAFLNQPNPPLFNQPDPPKRPAVIVCAGGAFQECDRHSGEGDPVAMSFAIDGYQSFVLEYSVATKAPGGKVQFPIQMLDYGKAIMLIRENTEKWNVDVDKISIVGFSAAGYLCGQIAVNWNNGLLENTFHVPATYFKPLTAILVYPVIDYELQEDYRKRSMSEMPFLAFLMDMNKVVFGVGEPDDEALKEGSINQHVTKDCPPVFIAAAQDDMAIHSGSSLQMALALQKAGVSFELHMFEHGGHGFALGKNLMEPYRKDKEMTSGVWISLAKTFLLHHIEPGTAKYEFGPFA